MALRKPLAIVLALTLASGCLATFGAHDELVGRPGEPQSTPGEVVFYVLLPVLIAIDVITSPFQFVHVITHAK